MSASRVETGRGHRPGSRRPPGQGAARPGTERQEGLGGRKALALPAARQVWEGHEPRERRMGAEGWLEGGMDGWLEGRMKEGW